MIQYYSFLVRGLYFTHLSNVLSVISSSVCCNIFYNLLSYYNTHNLRLSVCPTSFNSETVADMEKFLMATPPLKSSKTAGNDLRFLKFLVFNFCKLFTLCCNSHQSSLPDSTLIELNMLIYSYTIVQHNRLKNV